jgi:hypothetical protein
MKILVYGTDKFEDYPTFMRGMVVAIEENITHSDGRLDVYTAGPHKINNFVAKLFFTIEKSKSKTAEDVKNKIELWNI